MTLNRVQLSQHHRTLATRSVTEMLDDIRIGREYGCGAEWGRDGGGGAQAEAGGREDGEGSHYGGRRRREEEAGEARVVEGAGEVR